MAQTGKVVDEARDPWYRRLADLPREWQRRYRGLDERQRFQVGMVVRALIVIGLFFIGWPLALFVGVIFFINYLLPRVPAPWNRFNRYVIPLLVLIVALTYPLLYSNFLDTQNLNLIGAYPTLDTMVIMGVYAIMAVGLNIVVGYAGLLDLGYVAFYAMGAYTVAWFASVQF